MTNINNFLFLLVFLCIRGYVIAKSLEDLRDFEEVLAINKE